MNTFLIRTPYSTQHDIGGNKFSLAFKDHYSLPPCFCNQELQLMSEWHISFRALLIHKKWEG